jgi:LPXTG-motif cell wall-anchored protein
VAKGDLVVITFKGKAVGSGAVNFNCTANSVRETNIINDSALDVVDCAQNQSGLYTITAASNGDSTPASTSTPTPTPKTTGTVTKTELPKTGAVETTILVMFLGITSLFGAVLLR